MTSMRPKKKNMCVYGPPTVPNFLAPTLNFFMALLVENYLNTLFLPSNVVFCLRDNHFDKNELNADFLKTFETCQTFGLIG